jgi:hypothetical protein
MARIRTIKPEFWTSEQIVECSPTARLLFIGMWNFADDAGNLPASAKTLKMQVFPGDDMTVASVTAMVDELKSAGLVVEYTAESRLYWHITGWHHQKIDKPTVKHPTIEEGAIVNHSTTIRRVVDEPSPPEGNGMDTERKGGEKKQTRVSALPCPPDVDDQVWQDFTRHRKAKGAPITETALRGIEREAQAAGMSLQAALEICCQRGWTGFKAEWVMRDKLPGKIQQQTREERDDAMVERARKLIFGAEA